MKWIANELMKSSLSKLKIPEHFDDKKKKKITIAKYYK